MKLLHLADLHAGKNLGGVSRNEDLRYALEQVLTLVKEERPQLVLVAGDVFDKPNPDNEAKEVVFDFFLSLRALKTPAVVVSGNHDSYEFMKSLKKLLEVIGVYLFPKPDLERAVFSFGELKVACLPYPSERVLTAADEKARLSYALAVEKALKYLAQKVKEAKFKVLLTHLFIAGAKFTRTEREATITDFYAVPPSALPPDFNYVALGHVHRHQRIEKASPVTYYTGSLYQLDFSESGQDKFVNLIELREGEPPRVEAVKLDLKRPLHFVELREEEALRSVPKLRALSGLVKVRLYSSNRERVSFVADRLKEYLGDKLVKLEVVLERELKEENLGGERLSVGELYGQYYKSRYGKAPPEELLKLFYRLLEKAGL